MDLANYPGAMMISQRWTGALNPYPGQQIWPRCWQKWLWFVDSRNDIPCWIGATNFEPKWLRTWSAEIWHVEKSLSVHPIMLEDELWMRLCEKLAPNRHSCFLKTELQKRVLGFWILRLVRFGFQKTISDTFIGFCTANGSLGFLRRNLKFWKTKFEF